MRTEHVYTGPAKGHRRSGALFFVSAKIILLAAKWIKDVSLLY